MSAFGALSCSRGFSIIAFFAFALPWMGIVGSAQAQQTKPSTNAAKLADWDGEAPVTLDEIRLHALEIGDLLDKAGARVDQLADEASDHSQSRALLRAVRQELDLSRQWNRHLTSILLEVAEARRALGAREQKAAAEIFELTSIAEEARLELIALWESLRPDMSPPFGEHDLRQSTQPEVSPPPAQEAGKGRLGATSGTLTDTDKVVSDAKRVLDEMDAMQATAAGDIEAVRAKLIDALQTLAPHQADPIKPGILDDVRKDSGLSSKEITAWAASIAGKLHHEGFESFEQAEREAGSIQIATPSIEDMSIRSEILTTAAVRIAPDREALPIATVMAGSLILVTGKVIDQDWYRVEIGGGRLGYISGDLIKHRSSPSQTERQVKSS